MTSLRRRTEITIGLIGVGAIVGAAAGGIALNFSMLITPPLELPALWMVVDGFLIGGIFGAPLGAIAAPLLGWTILKYVPLGRMFAWCALGTVIGGVAGWIPTVGSGDVVTNSLAGATIGCIVAAINLWYRARLRRLEA